MACPPRWCAWLSGAHEHGRARLFRHALSPGVLRRCGTGGAGSCGRWRGCVLEYGDAGGVRRAAGCAWPALGNVRTGAGLHPGGLANTTSLLIGIACTVLLHAIDSLAKWDWTFRRVMPIRARRSLMRWRVSLMRVLERATRCCPCMRFVRLMTCSTCLNVRVRLAPWWATPVSSIGFPARPTSSRVRGGRAATSA